MCGRFTSKTKPAEIAETFDVDEVSETAMKSEPSYNVAPTQQILVVSEHHDSRRLETMKWGLVPFFAKDASGGARMINARAEAVVDKPAFRRAFEKRRCLIPVDGFYEWKPRPGEKRKQPWYFTSRNGAPLALGGLWEIWHDPNLPDDAPPLFTCTIITTEANKDAADVHDRMPLILQHKDWNKWLDVEHAKPVDVRSLLKQPKAGVLTSFEVSDSVNKADNDSANLIEPA